MKKISNIEVHSCSSDYTGVKLIKAHYHRVNSDHESFKPVFFFIFLYFGTAEKLSLVYSVVKGVTIPFFLENDLKLLAKNQIVSFRKKKGSTVIRRSQWIVGKGFF